jgi:hypothetical protein
VTIGAKGIAAAHVELKLRTEQDPKKADLVPTRDAADVIAARVQASVRA